MANGILDVTPLDSRLGQEAMLYSELMLSADTAIWCMKKKEVREGRLGIDRFVGYQQGAYKKWASNRYQDRIFRSDFRTHVRSYRSMRS